MIEGNAILNSDEATLSDNEPFAARRLVAHFFFMHEDDVDREVRVPEEIPEADELAKRVQRGRAARRVPSQLLDSVRVHAHDRLARGDRQDESDLVSPDESGDLSPESGR